MGRPDPVTEPRRSIARQAARRLAAGLGLVVLLVGLSTLLLYRQATDKAARERAEDVARFYQARLAQLEKEWELQTQATRVRIEHTRYLERRDGATHLQAYLTIQGGNRRYSHLLVQDRQGGAVLLFGKDNLALSNPLGPQEDRGWFFEETSGRLFRVFQEKIWLGGAGAGRMATFFPVDNAALVALAGPGVRLAVALRGQKLADSAGGGPVPFRAGPATEERVVPWGGAAGQPVLVVRAPFRELFSATELTLGVSVVPLVDAAIIWLVLGTWLIRTAGRVNALGATVNGFTADAEDNTRVARQARRAQAGQEDEIEEVAAAIESMAEQAAARERERREDEARRRLWAQVFRASGEAIVITDRENRIVAVNQAFVQSTGYALEEVAGEDPKLLSGRRERPEFYRDMWRKLMDAGFWRGEVWDRAKDGRLYPVLLSISVVRDEAGGIANYVASFVDIAERKEQEQELELHRWHLEEMVRSRTADLEASNRELEAFSYSVSHDLRTPLRGIEGFAHVLEEDYGERLDETGRAHLRRIRRASHRMAGLIDELLDLARLSRIALSRSPVDLAAMVREIAQELSESEPERPVAWRIPDRLVASADPALIRVALENLLRNAWKFTRKTEAAVIELGVREHGGERQYFVRDNGVGFDPAYAEKLFKAFERLHRPEDYEGSGVGLAIVERVIGRHGGRVWAETAPEGGATFHFTLGASSPESGSSPSATGRHRGLVPG